MKLFPEPTLDPDESIRNSWGANRGHAGGRLFLTNLISLNCAIAAYRSAMQAYEAMQATLSEDVQSGSDIYNAACVCSLASQPLDGEAGQLEELAIRAVTLLKKARDSGWDNLPHIMNDAELNPIRERQDFKEFVGTLKVAP